MFHKKRTIIKNIIFSSGSFTVIGFIVIVLISLPLARNIKKQINVNKEINSLDNEIKELEKKNSDLKGLISYLGSDQYVEEKARLNLNYKKKDEEVLIIKEGEEMIGVQKSNQETKNIYSIEGLEKEIPVKKKSNIKKWINYFWD